MVGPGLQRDERFSSCHLGRGALFPRPLMLGIQRFSARLEAGRVVSWIVCTYVPTTPHDLAVLGPPQAAMSLRPRAAFTPGSTNPEGDGSSRRTHRTSSQMGQLPQHLEDVLRETETLPPSYQAPIQYEWHVVHSRYSGFL